MKKLGWPMEKPNAIVSCIVTGNRMFYGCRDFGHPVVPIHELTSFLEGSVVVMQNKKYRIANRDKGMSKELGQFICSNVLHELAYNCMKNYDHSYQIGDKMMSITSSKLLVEELYQEYERRFGPGEPIES